MEALLEAEIADYLGRSRHVRTQKDPANPRSRNGYSRPRTVRLQCGEVTIRSPRTRGGRDPYKSTLLPRFIARSEERGVLLPDLFLHALALKDFDQAVFSLLGTATALPAETMLRLRKAWEDDQHQWRERRLDVPRICLAWADTLVVRTGRGEGTATLLVVIGEPFGGPAEVLGLMAGFEESPEAWLALQYELDNRGLVVPLLVLPGGSLKAWSSPEIAWPNRLHQLSWFHKFVCVLGQLPKEEQSRALSMLALIPAAATRQEAETRKAGFVERYRAQCPSAVDVLERDWEHMLAVYDIRKP